MTTPPPEEFLEALSLAYSGATDQTMMPPPTDGPAFQYKDEPSWMDVSNMLNNDIATPMEQEAPLEDEQVDSLALLTENLLVEMEQTAWNTFQEINRDYGPIHPQLLEEHDDGWTIHAHNVFTLKSMIAYLNQAMQGLQAELEAFVIAPGLVERVWESIHRLEVLLLSIEACYAYFR
ncbi:hypothetical protein M011DRAFT_475880 [Sporormia fimetaria CBS 119925]|uniref:Uncharacterized protein n=1 Tax=Sporormia fimetaria CBS 119925 TaxID=1340428 RepID=A0A6A6VEX7_9PLEO|nr:hypothetical protein M011DRAFT_475880 [Sporormia fimetaria CBS 119925]